MKFWGRKCQVIAGGKIFDMDELDIEFSVPFDNNEEPDIASLTLYNLSENSINAIKQEQNTIINAGYEGDIGTIFKGTITKTVTRWSGTEKITELQVGDGSLQWLSSHVSEAYGEDITAQEILQDLTGKFGIELGRLDLVNNITYPTGRIVDSSLKDAIQQIVRETNTTFKISKGRIFIMPKDEGVPTGFLLNKDTGLIGSPEVFEKEKYKGFKVTMLLNHRITIDSVLVIESKTANGTFRVIKGRHTNSGNDFLTTVEVVE